MVWLFIFAYFQLFHEHVFEVEKPWLQISWLSLSLQKSSICELKIWAEILIDKVGP